MAESSGVAQKLLEIQKLGVKYHKKGKSHYGKYLTLDDLLEQLLPELEKQNLLITHHGVNNELITSVQDVDSGSSVQSAFPLPQGAEPQKMGSAITYAKRYNLGALFNIVTDEDDDGEATVIKNDINI